jgi:hypothetical protein
MGYLGDGQNELITDGNASLHNSILDTTSRTVSGTTDYFTRDDQGLLLADRGPSSTKYYLLDPLGSVIATTNSNGAVSASYGYDPYGNSIGTAPAPTATPAATAPPAASTTTAPATTTPPTNAGVSKTRSSSTPTSPKAIDTHTVAETQ